MHYMISPYSHFFLLCVKRTEFLTQRINMKWRQVKSYYNSLWLFKAQNRLISNWLLFAKWGFSVKLRNQWMKWYFFWVFTIVIFEQIQHFFVEIACFCHRKCPKNTKNCLTIAMHNHVPVNDCLYTKKSLISYEITLMHRHTYTTSIRKTF